MYTRAPSEVIHGRSFPAKSMICAVQLLMSKLDEVAPWHVIAATEICAARKGLLTGITNVVACSVPVEPKSTSGVAATKHDRIPGLGQGAVYRTLQVWRGAEIAGPKLRSEGEQPAQ